MMRGFRYAAVATTMDVLTILGMPPDAVIAGSFRTTPGFAVRIE